MSGGGARRARPVAAAPAAPTDGPSAGAPSRVAIDSSRFLVPMLETWLEQLRERPNRLDAKRALDFLQTHGAKIRGTDNAPLADQIVALANAFWNWRRAAAPDFPAPVPALRAVSFTVPHLPAFPILPDHTSCCPDWKPGRSYRSKHPSDQPVDADAPRQLLDLPFREDPAHLKGEASMRSSRTCWIRPSPLRPSRRTP